MKKYIVAILLACGALSGCAVWSERPAKELTDATGGEGLERAYWSEVKRQHWNDVAQRLASNFIAVTPTAQRDRSATLEYLKQIKLQDYSLGDLQTELSGNTFVVTYTITLHGTYQGKPLPKSPQKMLTVWQQHKSGWMQIAQTTFGPEGRSQ